MLPAGGVDTVSLENNHVLDIGDSGSWQTKETLLAAGIPYASEGEPAILTVKGVRDRQPGLPEPSGGGMTS